MRFSYKAYFLLSIACFSIFLCSIKASHAFFDSGKDRASAEIMLDDQVYTRGDLIAAFLNSAFSNRFWNDDVVNKDGSSLFGAMVGYYMKGENGTYETEKKYRPWIADHIHRPNGWPKSGVVNKWPQSKISVAFGWPAYSQGQNFSSISPYNKKEGDKLYSSIEKSVRKTIPQLSGGGAPSLTFMPMGDVDDATENYARIRIVPTNSLKARYVNNPGVDSYQVELQERGLWGGVMIDASDPLMEAYILPDHNNNIDLVVCKINLSATEGDVDRLVPKCLMSALGLPELSKVQSPDSVGYATAYQKYLLKLLYCPAIKSGMDKADVFQVLADSGRCW
ncbi:hypothetical protein [Micavibrio aeruginosavorus]|uniref:Uncharacterized protein n=1 Tax=Micavibrio aeruginosavorus EPB TaxID=349215 RepID=M4VG38_9BACT|nr:hypothetical protein [Micavibrio aeruginosavorus]AGH98347.1 hypothetical protein A11S_1541 [Micavibrio aeruginosavorus EPB]